MTGTLNSIMNSIRLRTGDALSRSASSAGNFLLLIGVLALSGCATVGPQAITAGRSTYNEVINRTEDEQILNALVRLRYDETFGMMSVASVTASLRFRADLNTEIGIGNSANYIGNLVPLSAGVAYEENPTISYVPLNGEEFMRRMVSPLSIGEWVVMSEPARHKGLMIALAVHRLNGLLNPLPGDGPPSPEFVRFVELYSQLRRAAVVDVVLSEGNDDADSYFWQIHDYSDGHEAAVREMLDLIGIEATLDGSTIVLPLRQAVGRSSSEIHLQTRSPYDILRIYGAGIQIPAAHLEAGIVETLEVQRPKNWRLLSVHSSSTAPADATVQILFRDRWFYIDATDTQSKRAFAFLRTFIGIRLAKGGTFQQAPVLTVPVN